MPSNEQNVGLWATAMEAYQSPWFYIGAFALVVFLVLGFGLMVAAKRWVQSKEEPVSPAEDLYEFELLHMQGELSREELDRIRILLAEPSVPESSDTPTTMDFPPHASNGEDDTD